VWNRRGSAPVGPGSPAGSSAAQHAQAGDRLPSVRELSEVLNVNPNTVAKAYRDLEVMGYLYTRRGMGVFIQDGIEARCRKQCHTHIIRRLYEAAAEAHAAGLNKTTAQQVVKTALTSQGSPYGTAPQNIFKLAK